jgi:hypothetical protein
VSAENVDGALAVLSICPICAGSGKAPYSGDWEDPDAEMVDCRRCDGLGDLMGALLLRAYWAGREDALVEGRLGLEQLQAMLGRPLPQSVTPNQLRQRVAA